MTNTTIKNIAAQAMEYALSYIKASTNKETEADKANFRRDDEDYCYYSQAAMTSRKTMHGMVRNNPYNQLDQRPPFALLNHAKKWNVGNCEELTYLVLEYMQINHPGIEAEKFIISPPADHAFAVINRRADSDPADPSTWGDDCWFCDPWGRKCGKASELISFLKKLSYEREGKVFKVLGSNEEPNIQQGISSSQLLQNVKDDLYSGLCGLSVALEHMSIYIQRIQKTFETSTEPNERLSNWLKNKRQKIDDLFSKVEAQKKEYLDNSEKWNYSELEQKFYKARDDIAEPMQKVVAGVLNSEKEIRKNTIFSNSSAKSALDFLIITAKGFERVQKVNFDFPDAPKTFAAVNGEKRPSLTSSTKHGFFGRHPTAEKMGGVIAGILALPTAFISIGCFFLTVFIRNHIEKTDSNLQHPQTPAQSI